MDVFVIKTFKAVPTIIRTKEKGQRRSVTYPPKKHAWEETAP